ncbi:MAG TPA: UDP-4-amino-4,6-dideoxy-N-acetyl-beta-L-altrosamine transaminase [Chromatiaceae bacterium]|nr:UDP-4-amino-4,6-dideoxy-N-acetyl-beta-L-altrosamine transaminase [Chromatiaceae bacterium]
MIPYGRQDITQADMKAVLEVLKSDFITQGPSVPQFENALATYCGVSHAIAVNSATSALHIACLVLGLGKNDWLWTSPNTFVASANCGLYCGANVDFVDIDPKTYNMSIEALTAKLVEAEKQGTLPKIVIPVHFAGQSCEMQAISRLSDKYGFKIIEDASHAIGGKYLGDPVGNCRYSDITVFSFHPVKIITTAEGGIATTNDEELAARMRRLRSHGITRDPQIMADAIDGPWSYQQIELGFNYRITDIQAALGYSQLQRLDQYIERRHQIKAQYDELLETLPVVAPWQHPDAYSALHLYPVQVDPNTCAKTRKEILTAMRAAEIGVNVHYIPVHTQPYYQQLGFRHGDFPNAEKYYGHTMSLPMYPLLSDAQQRYVIRALKDALA